MHVNTRYNVRAFVFLWVYGARMNRDWFPRLLAVIEKDPRSKRKLSQDAGLGDNFVQQMIKNGKQPGAENLQALLDTLGYTKMIYVLTGIELLDEDEGAIRALLSLPAATRQKAKDLFLAIEREGDA